MNGRRRIWRDRDIDLRERHLCCSFGGGGGATQSTTFSPPGNTQPGWDQYTGTAGGLSNMPYQQSGIPSVAPFNDFQQFSQNMLYDRAANGAPDLNAGRGAVTSIAGGNQQNPWQAFLAGPASGGNQNPFMAGAADLYENGNNPFMVDPEKMIAATAADMTLAAQRGPMAQTDSMMNRAGAYGGSAYQELQAQNADELARGIGTMSATARLAADAQNANTWQQAQAGKLGAVGVGGNQFGQGLGQQIQAALGGGQMFNSDISNMLSAAGLSSSLSQDDWTAIANMMQGGNTYGAYQQALLNAGNQEFGSQQVWPYIQNEQLGSSLSRASGGQSGGGVTTSGPGSNPYWNAAGVGLAGYGLLRGG